MWRRSLELPVQMKSVVQFALEWWPMLALGLEQDVLSYSSWCEASAPCVDMQLVCSASASNGCSEACSKCDAKYGCKACQCHMYDAVRTARQQPCCLKPTTADTHGICACCSGAMNSTSSGSRLIFSIFPSQ